MALPCCENMEIPRLKRISKEQFDEEYLSKGQPVVIEGAIEDWPARHWTLDILKERAGENDVSVRSDTNSEEYRAGRKYNIRKTTFGEYIADLQKSNERANNSYLAVQNIKKALPQLQDDAPVPNYVGKVHGGPYLWIANQGHYEYCHFDPDDGLLIILNGKKQVRLFGCDIESMYPNVLGSKGRTVQSQVLCVDPDLENYPRFKGVKCYHCNLESGDMLFIPAFWWHQVTSTETTISINIFFGDAGTNTYLTKVMEPPRWPAFSYWLLNIIQQNRECDSFPRVLSRLDEALRNFLMTQWHEEASKEQLDILMKLVMDHCQLGKLPDEKSSGKYPPRLQIRGLLWRK